MLARDGSARRGVFETPHGTLDTPAFMPVATQATVKTLSPAEAARTGARAVLCNAYHLMLRPGVDVVSRHGGLHAFARWPHVMITDSGGFQAFSLSARVRAGRPLVASSEEGFAFKSHIDGSPMFLSPEEAVRVQACLGADVQMQLDVCPPGDAPRSVVEDAVARTTRWAARALRAPRASRQALFGIVQGGIFADLRTSHAQELGAMAFDGLALGGFSVGEPPDRMHEILHVVAPSLDEERPRYLMGVGTPRDLIAAMDAGVDMFDCVLPTRNARNGQAFTALGSLSVKQARWRDDTRPLDESCTCDCCSAGFSRAYLRHLYMAREILCLRLLSAHNLHYYGALMASARKAIEAQRYDSWSRGVLSDMRRDPAREA